MFQRGPFPAGEENVGFEHAKLSLKQGTRGFAHIYKPTGTHTYRHTHAGMHANAQPPGKKEQSPEIKHHFSCLWNLKQELLDRSETSWIPTELKISFTDD